MIIVKKSIRKTVVMFLAVCCITGNLSCQTVNASSATYKKKYVANVKSNNDKKYNALEFILKVKEPATVKVTVASEKGKQKSFNQKLKKGRNKFYYLVKSQIDDGKCHYKVIIKAKKALLRKLRCNVVSADASVGYRVN